MIGTMAGKNVARGATAALAAAVIAMGGCAQEEPELVVAQPAPPGVAPVEVTLNSANIAALTLAANNATMARARVARTEAEDPQVRAFASEVLAESQAGHQLIQARLNQLGITPVPEATSRQVEATARETVVMMREADGLEVDRIYLESEIDNDRWLLQTADSILSVTSDKHARRALQEFRATIADRLRRAERLQASVVGQMNH